MIYKHCMIPQNSGNANAFIIQVLHSWLIVTMSWLYAHGYDMTSTTHKISINFDSYATTHI